ncbi:hypothetical protein DASB73_012510 [Starmerella bacillaris]|uniref:ribonuclease H n=1 Tax=Starmerella bacillaris TaxID=1247836 RepID=A0AAV5RHS5_STABA|nr:hypothetical protein DASB73_012510 [Starmerella bacillaris]
MLNEQKQSIKQPSKLSKVHKKRLQKGLPLPKQRPVQLLTLEELAKKLETGRKIGAAQRLLNKKRKVLRKIPGGRRSAFKAFRARNILQINIVRLFDGHIPSKLLKQDEPPEDVGYEWGFMMHVEHGNENEEYTNGDIILLSETAEEKAQEASPLYKTFKTYAEHRDFYDSLNYEVQRVYTDGSHFKSSQSSGYAVYWGDQDPRNSYGPVPNKGIMSSAKAEEYALLIALLQIKGENSPSKRYEVYSDALWVIQDVASWYRRWSQPDCPVGWKSPITAQNSHREILRVAAGLLWDLRFRGVPVSIYHVRSHTGVPGNEKADLLAKLGATSNQTIGAVPLLLKKE